MISAPRRRKLSSKNICVSLCSENALDLVLSIPDSRDVDIVELRLDCLNKEQRDLITGDIDWQKPYLKTFLFTLRPQNQGGKSDLSKSERLNFWRNFLTCELNDFIDLEFDLTIEKKDLQSRQVQIINSFHDFKGVPKNLEEIYEKLSKKSGIIKIAVQADNITDAIPVWKLLERARSDNKKIIPIAMGEVGKWTRILGLAHGALMTYAALETGSETAPGQVSVKDLTEVYRVKKLNERTEIYGILGGNTSYSLSPLMQNAAFKQQKLNAVFLPLQVKNLGEFMRRMVREESHEIDLNFRGFAVTIPHKQTIIEHLDYLDEAARKIGAVNTVKIADGKLHGFNTDAHGFIEPLRNFYGDLRGAKVAVFGAGGAARACLYALKKENAEVTVFARDVKKAKNLAAEFQVELRELETTNDELRDFEIVVNATPLGTKGAAENASIVSSEQIKQIKLVYDLVYNPFQTRLLAEAAQANVPQIGGTAMLVAQGAQQFEIWTGKPAPVEIMSAAVLKRLN
ncbi:MAG: shikimate dehydrogenase [Pyrinomonadaceae bacterium]